MVIKVLGAGCANCQKVVALAQEVVTELGLEATVEKVTDMQAIMSYGVMSTPGLVIDETVVGSGGIPSKAQMKQLIQSKIG
ncbi:thioredoxin family protein [Anaerolineales bacterium HSG24]|nr:thioredoxin family protein [Anaerolineales bacterium HSG24]